MFASFNARAIGVTMPAARAIDLAAAVGFGGVDLLVRDLVEAGTDPKALRSRMDDLGLRGGAWPLPVDWRGDAGRFAADLAGLPRLAEAAAILGLTRTCTWVMPGLPPAPAGLDPEAHRRSVTALHVERLGAIARTLAAAGTRLGLEVIGVESSRAGSAGGLYAKMGGEPLDSLLAQLRRETPGVGVLVDAFHLYAAGEPAEVGWARGVESVVWVHVADVPGPDRADRATLRDGDRGLPGDVGAVEAGALLAGLARRGYDGPVTAEPMAGCRSLGGLDPEAAARRTLAALQTVWPGPLRERSAAGP